MRRRLTDWFALHARDLPWRRHPTPYRVWVSEVMLQQTQVATVVDYYERFLQSFPTVEQLAAADSQQVLSLWEGLGYYRRARAMHLAAQAIVQRHGGEFPVSYEDALALPGIGRYTAGAILSIARDQPLPILEGNTQRVFSRWIALRGPVQQRSATQLLWQVAETMLPRVGAGSFNQAAMELGALLCTPTSPDCNRCPLATLCAACKAGLQSSIPGKLAKTSYQDLTEYALVVRQDGGKSSLDRYLVRMLPEGGRWAGLWDFPRTMGASHESPESAACDLSRDIGVAIDVGKRIATIRHTVTRYRIRLHVYRAELREPNKRPPNPWKFLSLGQLEQRPMSVTGRQITQRLRESCEP